MEEDKTNAFFTLEGLIMMGVAIFFDLIGFATPILALIPVVGTIITFILNEILDLIALATIGGWLWFRASKREVQVNTSRIKKPTKRVKQLAKTEAKTAKWAKRLKWLRPLLIFSELIPVIDFLPDWTITVYLELKYS